MALKRVASSFAMGSELLSEILVEGVSSDPLLACAGARGGAALGVGAL